VAVAAAGTGNKAAGMIIRKPAYRMGFTLSVSVRTPVNTMEMFSSS